jgi:hypothetical protein
VVAEAKPPISRPYNRRFPIDENFDGQRGARYRW